MTASLKGAAYGLAPLVYSGRNGRLTGVEIEIVELMANGLHMDVEWTASQSWSVSQGLKLTS